MTIEGRAAHPGSIEHLLNGDLLECFFMHEGNQRIAQRIASAPPARIHSRLAGFRLRGHRSFSMRYSKQNPPICSDSHDRLVTCDEFLTTFLCMTDNRKAGLALILGGLGIIVTMAIHPAAGGMLTQAQVVQLARMSAITHSLGIASAVVLFLGACGLTRHMASDDHVAFTALIVFGLSIVSVSIAAAVSGFIIPNLIRQMAHDISNTPLWQIQINSMFQVNQAFAAIFSVAALLAIGLWSTGMLRRGGFSRTLAIYGCVVAPLLAVPVLSGILPLNVHGMGIVALGMAIWFVGAGGGLMQQKAA